MSKRKNGSPVLTPLTNVSPVSYDVPPPGEVHRRMKYRFSECKLNGTFLVLPTGNEPTVKTAQRLRSAVRSYESLHKGVEFALERRNQEEHGETGVRVWRVK